MGERGGLGVYLRPLPDSVLPARHSAGARRRAAQLQGFFRPLQIELERVFGAVDRIELLIVNAGDWRRLTRHPYGLPFSKTLAGVASVIGPADHRPRLLHRFDELLLRAGRSGVNAPGDLREYLDLLLGYEWGRSVAGRCGLRTRVSWIDEFVAGYLLLQALEAIGADGMVARLLAWCGLALAAGGEDGAGPGGCESFRSRLPLEERLRCRAMFTRRAAELAALRGWSFPVALRDGLGARGRGAAAEVVVAVEPSLAPWVSALARGV